MRCSKCKNSIHDYDKFCGNCGNELSSSERYERLELKIKSLEDEINDLRNSFRNHEKIYSHDMNESAFRL